MTRLAITADWHIPAGDHPRHDDFARSAAWMVEDAYERDCDGLLFAGDLYPSARPGPKAELAAANAFAGWEDHGSPWFGIPGNHDGARDALEANTVAVAARMSNGLCHATPSMERIGDLQLAFFPWPTAAWAAAKGVVPNATAMRNLVTAALANLAERCRADSIPTVLVAHLPLLEATTSSERLMALTGDWAISVEDIPSEFKATFLGHIHRPQCLRAEPAVWYCGAVDRTSWNEEDAAVGYLLYNSDTGAVEHVPNPLARQWLTIEYRDQNEATGSSPYWEDPLTISEGAMIRVRVAREQEAEAREFAERLTLRVPGVTVRVDLLAAPATARTRAEGMKAEMQLGDLVAAYGENRNADADLVAEARELVSEITTALEA